MKARPGVGRMMALVLLALTRSALADGILVPPLDPDVPYFTIKYHHVSVEISDQVATTHVDQVFVNETNREQEATYIFPLPSGAMVKDFALVVDGERMAGELLPREKAVSIYEEIVRKRKDPALLEYTGRDTYKARLFPIPPRGERRIEIRYTEVLPADGGLVAYNYPMGTEKFTRQPVKETVFEATIKATGKVGAIYSPTHDIDVVGKTSEARVSYEERNTKPDRDLLLYYALPEAEVGTSLLTCKSEREDGYFLLLAAPAREQENVREAAPKNVVFVLDRSGSMAGEKIEQARKALRYCVDSLNPQDHFEIITFATGIKSFGDGLQPATPEVVKRARDFIDEIRASGGTDIDGALKVALAARRPGPSNYIAFLTDGLPTVGEVTDTEEIVRRVKRRVAEMQDAPTRLFCFGVGYDVDTHFLDSLAAANRGVSTYVRPKEDIEVKVSGWFAKIAQPVLTEVSVDFGAVKTYDTYPQELPDLFAGSQLVLVGRYKAETAGQTIVTLCGTSASGQRRFETELEFPAVREGTDYVASLWASRRIGHLLDQIRLHGKDRELVDEIIALSTKFGILTEYTAFLATDDRPVPLAAAPARAMEAMGGAFGERRGGWATSQTENAQQMKDAVTVARQNRFLDRDGTEVQVPNVQNRGQRGFVQRGGQWQDLRYRPESHPVALRVQAYSEAYFQLSRAFPELNQFLAVSDNLIVMVNGHAVQIGPQGQTSLSEAELAGLRAAP